MGNLSYYNDPAGWTAYDDGTVIAYPIPGGGGGGGWNGGNGPIFGFNTPGNSISSYDPAGETPAQINTRLTTAYGNFVAGKTFPNSIPSSYTALNWASYPHVTNMLVCMSWTFGTIASGSLDSQLLTFIGTIPSGKTARLTYNEPDNGKATTDTDWNNLRADMDHLYDLVHGASVAATIEVWDCFMQFSLETGTFVRTLWTNAAKRDGITWDVYWNTATTDKSGLTKLSRIVTEMNAMSLPRWAIGETGDRRPGSGSGAFTDDTTRASTWTTRLANINSLSLPPQYVTHFNVIGSTGDHRILLSPLGSDTLTSAAFAAYSHASRGE